MIIRSIHIIVQSPNVRIQTNNVFAQNKNKEESAWKRIQFLFYDVYRKMVLERT